MTGNLSPRELVLGYFRGVDEEGIDSILGTLSEDCVFTVETHGVRLTGHAEIAGMFKRLWDNHEWVRHDKFHFIEDAGGDGIAVRFQVTNKLHDGTTVHKSNCNFFTIRNGLFSEIRVYMAGANTLNRKKPG